AAGADHGQAMERARREAAPAAVGQLQLERDARERRLGRAERRARRRHRDVPPVATEEAARLAAREAEREREACAVTQVERGTQPRPRSRRRAVLDEAARRDGLQHAVERDAPRDRAELGRAVVRVPGREAEIDLAVDETGTREAGLQIEERRRVREAEEGAVAAEGEAAARRRLHAEPSRRAPEALAGEEDEVAACGEEEEPPGAGRLQPDQARERRAGELEPARQGRRGRGSG